METAVDLARAQERIDALERWQDRQNGEIRALNDKMDRLSDQLNIRSTEITSSFNERCNIINRTFNERFDSLKTWLVGGLTSTILMLAALVASMVIGRP